MSAIFSLPPDVRLEYLAEGAANIVYKLQRPSGLPDQPPREKVRTPPAETDLHTLPSATSSTTPPPTDLDPTLESSSPPAPVSNPPEELRSRLLRLRKAVPWIPSYASLFQTQATLINPHFPASHLVPQTLVLLPKGLAQSANAALLAAEEANKQNSRHGRPPKRHGLYLAEDEPHGLLIQDMSASAERGESLVEVKPKWLTQSPNAPAGATRCRTCALRAMRHKSTSGQPPPNTDRDFCPLALASGDAAAVETAVRAILAGAFGAAPQAGRMALQRALVAYFLETPVLPRLRALQGQLDPGGILDVAEGVTPGDDFLVATTLRDCTLFVRTRVQGDAHVVEGRLGDLDLKAPEPGKVEYWRGLERDLIGGGWYEGKGADGKCWLESGARSIT